jgi:phospholipid-binding lipoprotein MlaA
VILVLGMLVGCSSTPKTDRSDLRDPFEHTNRKIFAFNMGVDSYVLEPVADGYRSNVPNAGRRAVDNHLDWVGLPTTALNSTIQGDLENAALATIHFAINGLTFGFAELTEDPSAVEKLDFGQTLARANVPEGDYLMVPLLGAHSSRNLAGRVVDTLTNPLSFFQVGNVGNTIRTAQIPARAVAFRANNFDTFNDLKYNSMDSYARTRSLYYQMRKRTLRDHENSLLAPNATDDQFDAFFEENAK